VLSLYIGGALFVRDSWFWITWTTMTSNHAIPSTTSSSLSWNVVGNGVGGAISLRRPSGKCIITTTALQSCSSVLGGGIFFEHGGVLLSSFLSIVLSSFTNNLASSSGGAIYFTDAYGLEWQYGIQLINNSAPHGPNLATPAVSLVLINSSTIPPIVSPGDLLPPLSVMLVDRLNQVVLISFF
jgi:hypothetical protein